MRGREDPISRTISGAKLRGIGCVIVPDDRMCHDVGCVYCASRSAPSQKTSNAARTVRLGSRAASNTSPSRIANSAAANISIGTRGVSRNNSKTLFMVDAATSWRRSLQDRTAARVRSPRSPPSSMRTRTSPRTISLSYQLQSVSSTAYGDAPSSAPCSRAMSRDVSQPTRAASTSSLSRK